MAFTQNFNSNTSGPVHWELMGPIADRPATADLHTTYLSTDEGDGVLKAYLYTESGWMQMQGIEGFTGGGGGSGGGALVFVDTTAERDTDTGDTNVSPISAAGLSAIEDALNAGKWPILRITETLTGSGVSGGLTDVAIWPYRKKEESSDEPFYWEYYYFNNWLVSIETGEVTPA